MGNRTISWNRVRWVALILLPVSLWAGEPECQTPGRMAKTVENEALRVVTLNMAHGRKDGRNQMLLKGGTIRDNLVEVAAMMDRSDADVIALQEADAESAWSGRFNHVGFLAEISLYDCFIHGVHASKRLYDFGTALVSPHPFDGGFSHSFESSWPTTTKGFVIASLPWNPGGRLEQALDLKLVSVHLDFSRRKVRRAQIDEMVAVLKSVSGPMIVMGDFNTDWQTEDSSLKYLADKLGLEVYEPHADGLSTYGEKGARLDWILVTPELAFRRYYVAPDIVSDHYAVGADIVMKEPEQL